MHWLHGVQQKLTGWSIGDVLGPAVLVQVLCKEKASILQCESQAQDTAGELAARDMAPIRSFGQNPAET